jgi:hypothetical protein
MLNFQMVKNRGCCGYSGLIKKLTCHVGTQKENAQTGGPGEACPDELLPIASTALI